MTYTLAPEATAFPTGETTFRFQVLGPDGAPVTTFTPIHDRKLHLILARQDLTDFWHLHPAEEANGFWSVPLNLPDPGAYRVFTDVAPQGETHTLTADLTVGDTYDPRPIPEPTDTFTADDYEITLQTKDAQTTFTITKNNEPVRDLQPYLAAYGHLVVLRAGDLAYIHVHPDEQTEPGPGISFHVELPEPGTYRLFLDFKHQDTVRTAQFTRATR